MTLSEFWKDLETKAQASMKGQLQKKGWRLVSTQPWAALPVRSRPDVGRIELAVVEAPFNPRLLDEVRGFTADELLERIEWVEKHAKTLEDCCQGECPECFAGEDAP